MSEVRIAQDLADLLGLAKAQGLEIAIGGKVISGKVTVRPAKAPAINFERFWSLYPSSRKVDKPGCLRQWLAADLEVSGEAVIRILEAHKRQDGWVSGKFIPMTTTWFNQERWKLDVSKPAGSSVSKKSSF